MSVSCDVLVRFIPVTRIDYLFVSFFGFVFLSLGKMAVQLATTGNCEVTFSAHIEGGSTGFFLGGGYLPSLSIDYVAMSKDMEKRLPQLYYIKMKISYDLGFITIGVAMAT